MIEKKFIYVALLVGLGFTLNTRAESADEGVTTFSANVRVQCQANNNSKVSVLIDYQEISFPIDDQVCANFIKQNHKGFHCGIIHVDLIMKVESSWMGLPKTIKVIDFQNVDEQESHGHC
jgi:hypothetical protein